MLSSLLPGVFLEEEPFRSDDLLFSKKNLKGFGHFHVFKMNRIFGRSKGKDAPPNLSDCIGNVSIIWL